MTARRARLQGQAGLRRGARVLASARSRPRIAGARLAGALLASGLALACGAEAPRPDVVLVVVDNLRADRLGAYGHTRATSPVFDALAREGELFTRVQATSSWTRPSVASLFSSLEPGAHGAVDFSSPLRSDVPTLAEAFRAAGYRTVGVSGNFVHVNEETGLARGFQTFRTLAPPAGADGEEALFEMPGDSGRPIRLRAPTGAEVNREVLSLLPPRGDRPLFLYVHYMEPHAGYDPPAAALEAVLGAPPHPAPATSDEIVALARGGREVPEQTRARLLDLYDGEVAAADAALGALLVELGDRGWLDAAVLVVVSDHGEEFGEHDGFFHARTLHGESLWVPLLIHDTRPGAPRGRRDEAVDLLDVAPTLLARADLPVPGAMRGRSLDAPAEPRERLARLHCDPVFEEYVGARAHDTAWLSWPWKAIVSRDGSTAWYDLERDPGERSPEEGGPTALPADRRARVARLAEDALARAAEGCSGAAIDRATREGLRALGYAE